MSYTILETHCIFEDEQLAEVAVLWEDNDNVRATYSNTKPLAGHISLSSNETLTPELLQRVAGAGAYLDDERKQKYFPGERNWSR